MQTIPLKKFSTPFSHVSSIFSHWYESLRANQFIRLVQHFVRRAFSSGLGSETGAWHLGLGGILGLLAIPGAFASLLLLDKYSTLRWLVLDDPRLSLHELMLPDRYFFVVLSTVATGLVVVVRWDGLLPDRQDFANLAPLPISYGRIFGANLVALLCVACLVGLAVNVFSATLFPLLVATAMNVSFFHLLSIHAISVFAASLFAFFFCTGAMSVPTKRQPIERMRNSTSGSIEGRLVKL